MANEEEGYLLSGLVAAVKQIPVLAIRKYSYEHAFAYFRETLQYSNKNLIIGVSGRRYCTRIYKCTVSCN